MPAHKLNLKEIVKHLEDVHGQQEVEQQLDHVPQ
jgi:predicted small metal-binding protein